MRAWFYEPAPDPRARLRLFCFPYAGGGPAIFRAWPSALPERIELVGVRMPGRESRWGEPGYDDWGAVVDDLVDELSSRLDLPYVLYGHSFGGMLAYEFARAAQTRGLRLPRTLIVSGCRAPHLAVEPGVAWDAPSAQLWRWVAALNATPAIVLEDAAFRAALEPALRDDLRLAQSWRNAPSVLVDAPLVTFGGTCDPIVTPQQTAEWRSYTGRSYAHVDFQGGHFFPHESEAAVLESISTICAAALSAERATVRC